MGLLSSTQPPKAGLLAKTSPTNSLIDQYGPSFPTGSFNTSVSTPAVSHEADTGDIVKATLQGVARVPVNIGAAAGQMIAEDISPTLGAKARAVTPTPTGLMADLIGSAPVDTSVYGDTAFQYESALKKFGIGGKFGTGLAVAGAVIPDALTFLGAGGEEAVAKSLLEADTAAKAAGILEKAGVHPDLIPQYSQIFADAGTKAEVDTALQALKDTHAADAIKAGADLAPDVQAKASADWEANFADQSQKLSEQISSLQNDLKAASAAEKPAIQASLDTVIKESGKLEDSFIQKWSGSSQESIGKKLVHYTTPENAAKITENGFKLPGTSVIDLISPKMQGQGVYFLNEGEKFGETYGSTKVEATLSPDAKILNLDKGLPQFLDGVNQRSWKKLVLEKGYDGVEQAGQHAIYNPDVLTATPTHAPMESVGPDAAAGGSTPNTIPGESLPGQAPEPTTSVPSVSLDSVKQIPSELSRPFQQVVDTAAKTTTQPVLFKRVMNKLGDAFTSVIEYVQNSDIRVRKLVEGEDMTLTDANNAYQKATLYPGKVASKIEDARGQMESIASDIVDIADKSGRDVSEVRADVNEYMQATHAPERNAVLGDGAAGMTDAAAKAALERINALPDAAEIKQIAEQAKVLNQQGLSLLKDAGVISKDLFGTLTSTYKNHVPLNRILDGEEIGSALSVRGFDVRSTGIRRAVGSEREVADIMSNIQHNYEQAVIRSEKNVVDQATLAFVRDNGDALRGLMDVYKPKAIGKTFDDKIMMERTTDPSYLQLYENGKPIWIKIQDSALAVALKGTGREKLPTLLNTIGSFTRFYAGLATRFNPEFAFPNKIRDLQETMIYMAAQKDVGFKGAAQVMTKDPGSIKAVFDSIRGADTAGTRLYQEMRDLGGTTGGFGLSTRKQVELDFNDMLENAKSNPKQWAGNVVKYIDYWNTIFEDSTRLSVYKQGLSQGLSKERSAFLAKEASINFNRMGRGGPVINAIWMFSNASLQGSAKMIRALKDPKVAAAVIVTVGASTAAVNEWNDHINPDWRDGVTKWDRLNGLPVFLPDDKGKGAHYFVIPVSWGVKPIKVMADYAYDAAAGKETDLKTMTSDLFTATADAYNPLGGTNVVQALTPTVLDVPVDVYSNTQWSGGKIHPDFDKNAPKDVQYFQTLGQTSTGKAFIEGTKALQEHTGIALSPADMKYAFDQYIGGAGQAVTKTVNAALGLATGKPVPADEYPFISRFYRERTLQEVGQGAGGDTEKLQAVLQNQSRARFYATQAAEDKYTELKALPASEAAAKWNDLNASDPTLAAKVASIANQDKKGLNYDERLITQLGVADGQRALFLKAKFDALKSDTDKAALWQDYVTKGIITPQIQDQFEYLMQQQKNGKVSDATPSFLQDVTGAQTAYADEKPAPDQQKYYIRDNAVAPSDLEEAKAILFGEISNRPTPKQQLEAQTILNTAFNRMDEFRKRGDPKTLTEVLQMDNQYQAYKGKEYQRYKAGNLRPGDTQKTDAIDSVLSQVKDGTFQNNIGNSVFYVHKPDGRIAVNNKKLFRS